MATVRVSVWAYPNGDLAVLVDGFRLEVHDGTKVDFQPGGLVTEIELDPKGNNDEPWGARANKPPKAARPAFVARHTRASNNHDYHYDIIAHLIDGTSIKIDPVMIIR